MNKELFKLRDLKTDDVNLNKEEEILYYPLEKFFQILSLIKLKK